MTWSERDQVWNLYYAAKMSGVPYPPGSVEVRRIAADPYTSVHYAINVLKGRFPEAEAKISAECRLAVKYAMEVLVPLGIKRFPEAEEAIATRARESYEYAAYVLGDRFPAGEKMISEWAIWSSLYARDVIKGPFALGEHQIVFDIEINLPQPDNPLEALKWSIFKPFKEYVDLLDENGFDTENLKSARKVVEKIRDCSLELLHFVEVLSR